MTQLNEVTLKEKIWVISHVEKESSRKLETV